MTLFKNLVDGEWVEGNSTLRNINPSDLDEVIGEYACASPAQLKDAAAAARAAFAGW